MVTPAIIIVALIIYFGAIAGAEMADEWLYGKKHD